MKLPRIKFPWQKEKLQVADFRVIFMGSGEFAVQALKELLDLERLLSAGKIVLAVFSQPDRPVGREQKMTATPVKELALKYKVPVLEPIKLNEPWLKKVEGLKPDLLIVCDYGILLPRDILNIPKFGCINIHPSLLPKYRGSSPIQQALLDGEGKTGVTIMLLDEMLDHGPVLVQKVLKIKGDDNFVTLRERLAKMAGRMLIDFLPHYLKGRFTPKGQEHKKATVTRELTKEDGKLDWKKQADQIERMVRALTPWPGSYTRFGGKVLKILKVRKCKGFKKTKPGKAFLTKKKELAINCGKEGLILEEVQLEGKRAMKGEEFLRGHREVLSYKF